MVRVKGTEDLKVPSPALTHASGEFRRITTSSWQSAPSSVVVSGRKRVNFILSPGPVRKAIAPRILVDVRQKTALLIFVARSDQLERPID